MELNDEINELETDLENEDGLSNTEETNEEEVNWDELNDTEIPVYSEDRKTVERTIKYDKLKEALTKADQLDKVLPYVNRGKDLEESQLAKDIITYQRMRKAGTNERMYTDAEIIQGLTEFHKQATKIVFDSVEEEMEFKSNQKLKPLQDEVSQMKQYLMSKQDEDEKEYIVKTNMNMLEDAFRELELDKDTLKNIDQDSFNRVCSTYYPHVIDKNIHNNPNMRSIQLITKAQAKDITKKMIELKTNKSKINNATKGAAAPTIAGGKSAKMDEVPERKYDKSRGVPHEILDQELRKFGI
jgi:hypothetical protein